MNKRILSLLLAAVMVIGTITGCGSTSGTENAEGETTEEAAESRDMVVFGTPTAPVGLFNSILDYNGTDKLIDGLIFASLLKCEPDGTIDPYLAKDFTVADDSMSITFELNEGVKWHDGEELTMDDVIYTFEQTAVSGDDFDDVIKIKGAQEYRDGAADSIEGLVVDGNKLTIEFTEVFAAALTKIGCKGILPKHILGEYDQETWADHAELMSNPVGAGPYKMTAYESGSYVELAANEDFFLGKPAINTFIVKVINADSISAELTRGEIDFAEVKELKADEVSELESAGFVKYEVPDNMYQYISFNMRLPIFQDKVLRQAITYAIDREAILANIVQGRGQLIDAPFIPDSWSTPDASALNHYDYDPEKANQMLEEAGYIDADNDGIRETPDGKKLQFTLRCSDDSITRQDAVVFVKECLEKIGVDVEVSIEEDAKMCEDVIYNHNYEMYALNCYFMQDPDPAGWWHSSSATDEEGVGSFNFGSYKNADVDAHIEAGSRTLDHAERAAEYLEVAKQINEDAPMVFLYTQNKEIIANPALAGFTPGTFNILYGAENWHYAE